MLIRDPFHGNKYLLGDGDEMPVRGAGGEAAPAPLLTAPRHAANLSLRPRPLITALPALLCGEAWELGAEEPLGRCRRGGCGGSRTAAPAAPPALAAAWLELQPCAASSTVPVPHPAAHPSQCCYRIQQCILPGAGAASQWCILPSAGAASSSTSVLVPHLAVHPSWCWCCIPAAHPSWCWCHIW